MEAGSYGTAKTLEERSTVVKWVGWISAWPWEKKKLRKQGVKGEMYYNIRQRCFEYCEASDEVMQHLIATRPDFYPNAFTGVNVRGNPTPNYTQKYWLWGYWKERDGAGVDKGPSG